MVFNVPVHKKEQKYN